MILCSNCGAFLEAGRAACGDCGAPNPAFAPPPPPPPPPPQPNPYPPGPTTQPRTGDGKLLLVLFGLIACFVVGALFATALLLGGGSTNANYASTNTSANVTYANTSNITNTNVSNTNLYGGANTNVGSYGNMNANYSNMNANTGNTNLNSNRRPTMSPFASAEYKVLNNNYLSDSDVSSLSANQLRLLRNTVFAKYGRVFLKDSDLQDYFDDKSWYTPNESYTSGTQDIELTAADEANLIVIKAAEAGYGNQ